MATEGRKSRTGKIISGTITVVLVIMGYAFVNDVLEGLPFSRSTASWWTWAAGLFVFGVAGLLFEGACEWVFGPDDPWHRRPRRVVRIMAALVVVTVLVITFIIITRSSR
jgi:hypothetical protein